jgi:hypothetical protein
MIQISNEELTKISQFVASCNDMVNGKFILADIKITKILNQIAGSGELYNYIRECMIDFDFSREYHKAEVKNRINGGVFAVPTNPNTLVALVFCLLVECDAKRIDFYTFINENFGMSGKTEAYKNFSQKLLVPFRDAIAGHFGLGGAEESALNSLTESYKQDLHADMANDANSKFGSNLQNDVQVNYGLGTQNERAYNNAQNQNLGEQRYNNAQTPNSNEQNYGYSQNANGGEFATSSQFSQSGAKDMNYSQNAQNGAMYGNGYYGEQANNSKGEPVAEKVPAESKTSKIWEEICDICDNTISAVYTEKHIKQYLREELIYILKTVKYSTKYKDAKIISALVTAFDELTQKFRSVQFVFGELKNKIEELY